MNISEITTKDLFGVNNPQKRMTVGFGMLVLKLKSMSKTGGEITPKEAFELFKEAITKSKWSSDHIEAKNHLTSIVTSKDRKEALQLVETFTGYKVTPNREKAFDKFVDALIEFRIAEMIIEATEFEQKMRQASKLLS